MYPVSTKFKSAISAPARHTLGRVIIGDDNLYEGEDLVSFTVTRATTTEERIIGNAITGAITVEVINRDGTHRFAKGDVIRAKLGVRVADGGEEYVRLQPFIVDEVQEDAVKKTLTVKGLDGMDKAGGIKIKNLETWDVPPQYPITRKDYLAKVCAMCGISMPADMAFFGSDILLTEPPNLSGEESAREVIAMLAEASLCNAVIAMTAETALSTNDNDWEGCLEFRSIVMDENPDTIGPNVFSELTTDRRYGPINRLVLSRRPQNDDNFRFDESSMQTNGLTELIIANNAFLDYGSGNDTRELYIDALFQKVKGLAYVPFSMDWMGNPAREIGEPLRIVKTAFDMFITLYANETLTYNGGIRAQADMPYPTQEAINESRTTTVKDELRKTEMYVDKVNQEIRAEVSETYTTKDELGEAMQETKTAAMHMTAEQFGLEFVNGEGSGQTAFSATGMDIYNGGIRVWDKDKNDESRKKLLEYDNVNKGLKITGEFTNAQESGGVTCNGKLTKYSEKLIDNYYVDLVGLHIANAANNNERLTVGRALGSDGNLAFIRQSDNGKYASPMLYLQSLGEQSSIAVQAMPTNMDPDKSAVINLTTYLSGNSEISLQAKSILVQDNPLADFVIEQETSGNWHWRKWNSGSVEIWGRHTMNVSVPRVWGNTFLCEGSYSMTYPFTLSSFDSVNLQILDGAASMISVAWLSETDRRSRVSFYIQNGRQFTNSFGVEVYCQVYGRWK